jgi:hypothetical protein
MTFLADIDFELLPLLAFWSVVVIALVVSATASQMREPDDFEFSAREGDTSEPTRGPQSQGPKRAPGHAARRKTRMAISGGIPRRIG